MSQTGGTRIACQACGRTFTAKPEWAGRRLRCPCGEVLSMGEDPVDAASEAPLPVAAPEPRRPDYATFAPRRRAAQDMLTERADLGLMRELVLPCAVLGLGLAGRALQAVVVCRTFDYAAGPVVVVLAVEFVLSMIGVVGAFALCMKIFDLDPELPGPALLKLSAIVSVAGVVQFFGGYIGRGPMSSADVIIGLPCSWIVTAVLVGLFFGYIAWDAWRVGAILYLMRLAATLGVLGTIGAGRGRSILLGI